MKSEYIIIGVVVLVVLYALSKMQSGEVQRVPEFIGADTITGGPDTATRDAARASAFGALASVAQTETQANVARYGTDAQLKATELAGGVQRAEYESRERIQAAELDFRRFELPQVLDVQRLGITEGSQVQQAGISAQLEQYLASLRTQESLYAQDLANRLALQSQQIAAVQSASQTYRNQSLERQGTILNALSAIWGQPGVYNYQDAFGGPRPPGFFAPGGAFSQITGAAGRFLGNFGWGF